MGEGGCGGGWEGSGRRCGGRTKWPGAGSETAGVCLGGPSAQDGGSGSWEGSAGAREHGHGGLAAQGPDHLADSEGPDDSGAADADSHGSRTAAREQTLLWAQPDNGGVRLAGDLDGCHGRGGTEAQGGVYWDGGRRGNAGIDGCSWPPGAGECCEP